ncbi:hypothetical protein OQA88_4142 [Cercophora sp. LCS_1]
MQPTFKRHSGPGRGDGPRDNSMSFIYLTESQIVPPTSGLQRVPQPPNSSSPPTGNDGANDEDEHTKSYEMERITKLFEILSARSDIDHPVCVDCTEVLVDEMQKRKESVTRERDAYVNFLKENQANAPTDEELKAQEKATQDAKKAEAEALELLIQLEKEKESLDDEYAALDSSSKDLDAQEEAFWRERNAFSSRLFAFQEERDSVNSGFDHDSRQLEKLQRSNVYNDTFCISHDGSFATINGLRLGRDSLNNVDWPEINAAWGHALLLLVTVADKLNYRFVGYEPVPMGSTSRIMRLEQVSPSSSRLGNRPSAPPPPPKRTALDLFSSGDLPLGLTFMHRKFDAGMAAFLQLVAQLGAHVEKETASTGNPLRLPYEIVDDTICKYSIRLGGMGKLDDWTKALT